MLIHTLDITIYPIENSAVDLEISRSRFKMSILRIQFLSHVCGTYTGKMTYYSSRCISSARTCIYFNECNVNERKHALSVFLHVVKCTFRSSCATTDVIATRFT